MIFRLSQKLADKIKLGSLAALPPDPNPLTDWSAHLFVAARTQYILLCNTKALCSVVMYGKGTTDSSDFTERALTSIREFMEADGHGGAYERFLAPSSVTVWFAKALNRSVTGSMNDLTGHAAYWLVAGGVTLFEISSRLTETPMTALRHDRSTHGFPRQVFKEMVESIGRKWPLSDG